MKEKYIISLTRKFRSGLSILWFKKEYPNSINNKVINELQDYDSKKIKTNIKKKETHIAFSKHIYFLFKKKKFLNFLQDSFVQKVFFIQNRFFLVIYLFQILLGNKSRLWKKILLENNIGNPVRFFLYPQSSGNKIFHAYHIKYFYNFSDKIKFDYIFEFGGGYGNMANNFLKINPKANYIIFDTYEVSLLQYYYLKSINHKVSFDEKKNSKILLFHNINKLKKKIDKIKNVKNKLFISNWSLSEVPISIRILFEKSLFYFDYQLISFQKNFEKINNYLYFQKILKKNANLNRICLLEEIKYYNNNYYLLTKPK